MQWPPNYVEKWQERQQRLKMMRSSPLLFNAAWNFYKLNPDEFINDWCDTYDPRNGPHNGRVKRLPLILFPKQKELVWFLWYCLVNQRSGLIEKSRDMGATWVCAAFCVWLWIFHDDTSMSWGSRKEMLVDKLGDMDSIFEKIRMLVRGLPDDFLPPDFREDKHMPHMKVINTKSGSSITGEAGDNIGRGGRSSIYFKDEAAHLERPEKVEAAVGDNTNVQIDLSSVNGLGNVFHRKREGGHDWIGADAEYPEHGALVFVLDWRDHPDKDQAWYDKRRKAAEDAGLLHLFAQEVDRNYAASVEGAIIPYEWVQAAIDAHVVLGFDDSGANFAGLDVADGGGDTNALARRKGVVLKDIQEWGNKQVDDTGETTRKALGLCMMSSGEIHLQYDAIGVGAGVKAETNRLREEKKLATRIKLTPWRGSAKVKNPADKIIKDDEEAPKNKDFYKNLKAQAWWDLRNRFYRTWQAVRKDVAHDHDQLISIPSDLPLIRKLEKELCQATASRDGSMKMVVDKSPEGTKSPNLADAIVMCYYPVDTEMPTSLIANSM